MTPILIQDYPVHARSVTYAKDQPQYNQLPAVRYPDGCVVTRWQLNWKERLSILFGSGIFISKLTFNQPLQPMKVGVSLESVE